MAVRRGKHISHLEIQKPIQSKEENGDDRKGKEKNRNVPGEAEYLYGLKEQINARTIKERSKTRNCEKNTGVQFF